MARVARLAYDNLAIRSETVITSSADALGWPVSNLTSSARWLRWRSSMTIGNQNVDFTFTGNLNVTCVVLADVVVHTGGTVKAQYWTGAAWADISTFTVPSPNPTGILALWFANIQTSKIRILFTNTLAFNSFVEIGAAFIGTYFQPTVSLAPHYGLKYVDPSIVSRSTGGQRSADKRTPYFQLTGSFDFEPETDRSSFIAMLEKCGRHTPLVFAINPDDPGNFVYYGRFDETPEFRHVTLHRFSAPFVFSEDV